MRSIKRFFQVNFLISFFTICSVAFAENYSQLEANKKIAIKFLEAVANEHSFEKAAQYLGPHYIQHNPTAQDGIAGLKQYIQFLHDKRPQHRNKIFQVIAEGNYVVLHVLSTNTPQDRGAAVFDMFRFEHGKIVEHWDVQQDIPDHPANRNSMF